MNVCYFQQSIIFEQNIGMSKERWICDNSNSSFLQNYDIIYMILKSSTPDQITINNNELGAGKPKCSTAKLMSLKVTA